MTAESKYKRGPAMLVRIEGHPEPVPMVMVERTGMCSGGGVMLVVDRGDGEIERVVNALNHVAKADRLREVLRLVADEPNIDRARAMADAALY